MQLKGKSVTLSNYKDLFREYSADVLDEIRSAILDDTDILEFIEPCRNDSYKLNQLRLAKREGVDIVYLDNRFTAKTVYCIRRAYKLNQDISILLTYVSGGRKMTSDVLEKLAEASLLNIPVDKVNWWLVPYKLVDSFISGLKQGYPMWLFLDEVDGCLATEARLQILLKGMSLGVDVHPFLQSGWTDENIKLLISYGGKINGMLGYISPAFSNDMLSELAPLYISGLQDFQILCSVDDSGVPIYNAFQIAALGLAMRKGVATKEMFDCTLSDMEIERMMDAQLSKQ